MQPGFWGRIAISLRSEAKHPKGEPKARGICAPTPKTPGLELLAVTPVRAEPVEAFCLIQSPRSLQSPGAALSPQRATHFSLLRQRKVSKRKATLLSASLRFATGNLRCSVQPGSRANSLRSNKHEPCSVWPSTPRRIHKGFEVRNSRTGGSRIDRTLIVFNVEREWPTTAHSALKNGDHDGRRCWSIRRPR